MIKVSGVFLLFLRLIQRVSGVILDKSYPGKDKSEEHLLSLLISTSVGFSILVVILEK